MKEERQKTRLPRDPRNAKMSRPVRYLLSVLIDKSEKTTGVLRASRAEIAVWGHWESESSVQKHLRCLHEFGLIIYKPGSGRGVKSTIILTDRT